MRVGVVTASTYVAMLVLLIYFVGHECKKKKSSFTFEALMAGMNSKEKEMFKEELNKEVKKFRASQQKHHKQKAIVRKPPKKHKVKDKLPKFLPGICDPICAHQCVHGCDFRCCIPDYQQLHKIPRPPPMVVLPGSCSPTCSPTCRPLCTEKCCDGGPGGMFQSSKDLITLDTQSCPEGCSKECMPRCVISCCVQHMPSYVPAPKPGAPQTKETSTPGQLTVQPETPNVQEKSAAAPPVTTAHVENSSTSTPPETHMRHSVEANARPDIPLQMATLQRMHMQEAQQVRNVQRMNQAPIGPQLEGHVPRAYFLRDIKCGAGCPDFCAPLCQQGCCASAKRDYTKVPMLFKAPQLLSQAVTFQQFKEPLQLRYSALANQPKALLPLARATCPVQCFASCKPQCEVRCCTLNPYTPHTLLHEQELHSRSAFLPPLTVAQMMRQSQIAHELPTDDVKMVQQPRMSVARKRLQTMESNSNVGNYESNIETIHALSKDMISKPEPMQEDNASQRNHVETAKSVTVGGARKEADHKRSSFPFVPFRTGLNPYGELTRSVVSRGNVLRGVPIDPTLTRQKEFFIPVGRQPRIVIAKSATPRPHTLLLPSNANTEKANRNQAKKSFPPTISTPAQPTPGKDDSKTTKKDDTKPIKKADTKPVKTDDAKPLKKDDSKPDRKDGSKLVKKDDAKPLKKDDSKPVRKDDTKPTKTDDTKPIKKDDATPVRKEKLKPAKKDGITQVKKDVAEPTTKENTTPIKKDVINESSRTLSRKPSDVVKSFDVKKSNIPQSIDGGKKSAPASCEHQCPSECAPDCAKPCCNRQIVYEAFHKPPQKRAKVKYQLQMLK